MAFYAEDEDVWKCPKHPPRRRRGTGVCPSCLHERLGSLCPDCANVRPCACCAAAATTTTTTPSSFSSSSSSSSTSAACDGSSTIGRVARPIENEPSFRRSSSVGIPFFRSRFSAGEKENLSLDQKNIPVRAKSKTSSIFSLFRSKKSRKGEEIENRGREELKENKNENNSNGNEDYLYRSKIEDFERMLMRSRSVSVSMTSARGGVDVRSSPSKGKGWHFTSPMKVFRHKSSSKVVQDHSPLHRG